MEMQELADILREMYDTAPEGEKVLRLHLFGIKYAAELYEFRISDVVKRAGLHRSYNTEISKGRNLAKYVELKK